MSEYNIIIEDAPEINLTIQQGTPGAQGPAGPQGPQGPTGAPGADGVGIPAGGTTGQLLAKQTNNDFESEWIDPPISTGQAFRVAAFDPNGELTPLNFQDIDMTEPYRSGLTARPGGESGFKIMLDHVLNVAPSADSPDQAWTMHNNQLSYDIDGDGFSVGANGTGFRFISNNFNHNIGDGNLGSVEFMSNNFNIGNGTDPMSVRGISYAFGFGQINANVTVNGPIQGYGFQPSINAAATVDPSSYVTAFYDSANISTAVSSYTSVGLAPTIDEIRNNNAYNGININPTISSFSGNSSFNGVGIAGQLGTFGTGGFNGVNINPTITMTNYAQGIFVSMDNVTVFAGQVASRVIQDLTIATDLPGTTGNGVTVEYTGGGTAGSEVVSLTGLALSVQIEDGVSTAQQIANALNAYAPFTQNLNVTVSGTGSNPQTIQGPVNLQNGLDPGNKKAAFFDGDVEITGALSFSGALSIGKLNAFGAQDVVAGTGNPATIHGLVSNPNVPANANISLGDTIGVNTAMLLTVGDNATVTSALVGLSALALPAVVQMGSGSNIDLVTGATFAVSMDPGATGGLIDRLDLCRSVGLPNGVTQVTELVGYAFDLPFGSAGFQDIWGFFVSVECPNYLAGSLIVGTSTMPTNDSCGIELFDTSKAIRLSTMTTTQRDALTAVDGMVVFNTTTQKFQGYDGTSWVDLN